MISEAADVLSTLGLHFDFLILTQLLSVSSKMRSNIFIYRASRCAVVKNLAANAGDADSISGSGRSPGGGNGNLLQCSCLENSMDRGAWWAAVHGVAKSWTQLSTHTYRRCQCLSTSDFVSVGVRNLKFS